MQKFSNSSEFETNNAFSDGQVIFDGNERFCSPDALFNGMEFMRQQKEFQQKSLVWRNINVFRNQQKNGEGHDSVDSQTMKIKVISPPEKKYSFLIEGQHCLSIKLKQISLMNEKKMKKRLLLIVLVVNIQLCHSISNSMYFFFIFFLFSAFSFMWYFSMNEKNKRKWLKLNIFFIDDVILIHLGVFLCLSRKSFHQIREIHSFKLSESFGNIITMSYITF